MNETAATDSWGPYAERAARLVEAVQLIRGLWTGEWVTHPGPYYPIANARLYDVPRPPVPLYMAAAGPHSMGLAGQYGDGLITHAHSALDPAMRDAFAKGARAAGKDPATMPLVVESFVVAGDGARRRKSRRCGASCPGCGSSW